MWKCTPPSSLLCIAHAHLRRTADSGPGAALFERARPSRNEIDELGRSCLCQACEQSQIRNRHLALAGFDLADEISMHAKLFGDVFLLQIGIIAGGGYYRRNRSIPTRSKIFSPVSQLSNSCGVSTR